MFFLYFILFGGTTSYFILSLVNTQFSVYEDFHAIDTCWEQFFSIYLAGFMTFFITLFLCLYASNKIICNMFGERTVNSVSIIQLIGLLLYIGSCVLNIYQVYLSLFSDNDCLEYYKEEYRWLWYNYFIQAGNFTIGILVLLCYSIFRPNTNNNNNQNINNNYHQIIDV